MKLKEVPFRMLYKRLHLIKISEHIKNIISGSDAFDGATHILVYGYVANSEGMRFEVLSGVIMEKEDILFGPPSDIRIVLSRKDIEEDEIINLPDADNKIKMMYADVLINVSDFMENEELNELRELEFLDDARNDDFPDDVELYLMKNGFDVEVCWARIIGFGEDYLKGVLLNTPSQEFGVRAGDHVRVLIKQVEAEGITEYVCLTNLDS